MKDNEYWIRRSAVEALGNLDAKEFSDDIANMLTDPSPVARESALTALLMLKETRHGEKIEKLILDPSPKVRSTALRVMRETGITTKDEKILDTLVESSEEVRIEAIKYFSNILEAGIADRVLRLLPYGSTALRQEIIEYIKSIKPKKFQPIMDLFDIHALSKEALASLIEIASIIKDGASHQFILDLTGNVDEYLRGNAFLAIERFGFAEHKTIFEKALFDPSKFVRTIVLTCVRSDTQDDFLEKAKILASDPDENVRLALALAI
jgi:HEAT repeat protein